MLAPCFWGAPDSQAMVEALLEVFAPIGRHGLYAGDNLVAAGRNLGFLSDSTFQDAFSAVITADNPVGYAIMWRVHVFCWAARNGLSRPGDFVECGVASGALSAVMCRYLSFAEQGRTLRLFDAWDTDPRVDASAYGGNTLAHVRNMFASYPNVRLFPGYLPDSLTPAALPERISFLHLDLNSAEAEIACLERLFERMSPGAILLLDDFGHSGYAASHRAETAWFSARGYAVAELPTGQGIVIR